MKNRIRVYISLMSVLVLLNVNGQVAKYNSGNYYVIPVSVLPGDTSNNFIHSDFVNVQAAKMMNNGRVWYSANFRNDGVVGYDNSVTLYPGLTRFESSTSQTIEGGGTTGFYNLYFKNSGTVLSQSVNVSHVVDFTQGVIKSTQTKVDSLMNCFYMGAGSSWINTTDQCHVDGFVSKTGNTAFTFPVGNKGYYRMAAISAPVNATDQYACRYVNQDPAIAGYSQSLKAAGVGIVSNKEYWIVRRTSGSAYPQLTLSWDVNKTSMAVSNNISSIMIVRWDGSKWVKEGNVATSGNATTGTVTANITGYGIFTLASAKVILNAVNDTVNMVQGTDFTGNTSLNDTVNATITNTWKVTTEPLHGEVTMLTDGSYKYTPDGKYTGKDSLAYTITDAYGNTDKAWIYFNITPLDYYLVFEKHSTTPVLQTNGMFAWKYLITIKNPRTVPIDSIHVTDNLDNVFVSPITYSVTKISATGNLKANSQYNGSSVTATLDDVSSLAAGRQDTIAIELKVDPNGYEGPVYNQAVFDGVFKAWGTIPNVLSDDPTNVTSTAARRPTVTNIQKIDVFIPNGFSPNNDGVNDKLVITHSSTVSIDIEVFNRWGISVYRNKNYQNEWDGTGSGSWLGTELVEGTYYYVVVAKDTITGESLKYAGFVTLRR